jgi:hypothetical protein
VACFWQKHKVRAIKAAGRGKKKDVPDANSQAALSSRAMLSPHTQPASALAASAPLSTLPLDRYALTDHSLIAISDIYVCCCGVYNYVLTRVYIPSRVNTCVVMYICMCAVAVCIITY